MSRFSTRGEGNKSAKLKWQQVLSIRRLRSQGIPQQWIMTHYGISRTQLWRIVNKKAWAWL